MNGWLELAQEHALCAPQVKAQELRDNLSLCAGKDAGNVNWLNGKLRSILDGRLVEFCGKERNTLLHEVGEGALPHAVAFAFPFQM